jgi:hypothetical protein
MNLSLIATLLSMTTFALMILLMLQMRSQQQATAALIEDNRIRTGLFQDADESTSFILTRTIQNIADGESDPSLESDTFALRVVREVVKRKLPKSKWLEIQSNERLVHELYLLLREGADKKGPQVVRAKA